MTRRSTRNKAKYQAVAALTNLRKAVDHLAQLAAWGIGHSKYIDDGLPEIIAAIDLVIQALDKFEEGL